MLFSLAKLPPNLMFGLGVFLMTIIMVRLVFRNLRNRKRTTSVADLKPFRASKSTDTWEDSPMDAETKISKREVEFYERVREMTAVLDNKMIALQHLIAQSEAVLEELKKAKEESKS